MSWEASNTLFNALIILVVGSFIIYAAVKTIKQIREEKERDRQRLLDIQVELRVKEELQRREEEALRK